MHQLLLFPANDDASQSIRLIVGAMCDAIAEGLNERKVEKEKEEVDASAAKKEKAKVAADDDDEDSEEE